MKTLPTQLLHVSQWHFCRLFYKKNVFIGDIENIFFIFILQKKIEKNIFKNQKQIAILITFNLRSIHLTNKIQLPCYENFTI